MHKRIVTLVGLLMVLLLFGCSNKIEETPLIPNDEAQDNYERKALYENEEFGVLVHELEGFVLKKETERTATFMNEKLTVIISVIKEMKSKQEIKDELLKGIGEVTMIADDDHYIAWKSDRKESIRTDVYIDETTERTILIMFMTPLKDYQINESKIELFKDKVEIN